MIVNKERVHHLVITSFFVRQFNVVMNIKYNNLRLYECERDCISRSMESTHVAKNTTARADVLVWSETLRLRKAVARRNWTGTVTSTISLRALFYTLLILLCIFAVTVRNNNVYRKFTQA